MYEQSIPALAYVFIGITSLVVTYSQITGKDVESTEGAFDQPEETIDPTLEETPEPVDTEAPATNPFTNIASSVMNTISPTAPPAENESYGEMPVAQAVPVQEDVQKIGGKYRKTKNKKQKQKQKVKVKRKTKRNRKGKGNKK